MAGAPLDDLLPLPTLKLTLTLTGDRLNGVFLEVGWVIATDCSWSHPGSESGEGEVALVHFAWLVG